MTEQEGLYQVYKAVFPTNLGSGLSTYSCRSARESTYLSFMLHSHSFPPLSVEADALSVFFLHRPPVRK